MKTITERIEEIVNRRSQHLPQIQAKKNHLRLVEEQLSLLNNLLCIITNEVDNEEGEYYALLANDLEARHALSSISTDNLIRLIKEYKEKLDILEKRFGRDTIRIAMIGFERQGKSTFLRAISGLQSNKVIPAYSGNSCTGTVSVIHNINGPFRVEITPYTLEEFLNVVRDKLKKFFPNRDFYINSPIDLEKIDLTGFSTSSPTLTTEFKKFKAAYCEHVRDYESLVGRKTFSLYDEDEVIQHVAQYERFDELPITGFDEEKRPDTPNGKVQYQKNYYKYVAVKHVDIFTTFDTIDSKKIELVDTVGLGDATNADRIEKEMFRVLREDCDAAVDLFQPTTTAPGINKVQLDILEKIRLELKGRHPYKWIGYVINKNTSEVGYNVPRCEEALQQFQTAINNLKEEDMPVAWAKVIDGLDKEDVEANLVLPLLDLIAQNLDDLDNHLLNECVKKGEDIYTELCLLCGHMKDVISNATMAALDQGEFFDNRMTELTDSLHEQLLIMEKEEYFPKRNSPQEEIEEALNEVIKGLNKNIPSLNDVKRKVAITPENLANIYNNFCDIFINNIVKSFDTVAHGIVITERNKVRNDMIKCIYEYALFKKIRLTHCKGDNTPLSDWLRCLMYEKLPSSTYPHLYDALNYALSYDFNIGYSIEYEVAKCLDIIDQLDDNFIIFNGFSSGSTEQKAGAIVMQMYNRLPELRNRLRIIADKFSRIPSYSFYTRIHNFVMKICRDKQVESELRKFCRNNAQDLMGDELAVITAKDKKLKEWNQMCDSVWFLCQKEMF